MHTKELIYLLNEELNKTRAEKKNSSSLPFIIQAYTTVIRRLNDNFSPDELINKTKLADLYAAKQITKHMQDKLIGLLDRKIIDSPAMKKKFLFDELRRIVGIGPHRAQTLVNKGLRSIKELKEPQWWNQLNVDTQAALKTQPMRKIPHDDIARIESILIKFPEAKVQLVGSYRRKTPSSRDIDIMIVSTKLSVMNNYLKYLDKKVPHIYLYSKGADKMSLVLEFNANKKFKADVFKTHPDYYWAHLLYATGSKSNNIRMRAKAKRMGYLLNQKGLWKAGERILGPTANEKKYYEALNLPYLRPELR